MESEAEDMTCMFRLPGDFPLEDLYVVSERLSVADAFVPGYIPPEVGLYHLHGHLYEHLARGVKTVLLPDRNVASRIAQLAQGRAVRTDEQLRTAAALLAFAQCTDIEFDPSVAFHELAYSQGNEAAWDELGWFRAADNVHPREMIEVALARCNALASPRTQYAVSKDDLAKPLRRWRRNYVIALKVVELEQLAVRPVDRVVRLLDWMRDDFIFGGPAALLASVYFAPNSSPKRRVFKDCNSRDREAAIAGIRNAAWDLTHISEFARRVNDDGQEGRMRFIFASFDVHLRRIARLLFEFGTDRSAPDALPAALSQWWSRSDASRIASTMFGHIERCRKPDWRPKSAADPSFIDDLIARGEDLVRSRSPT